MWWVSQKYYLCKESPQKLVLYASCAILRHSSTIWTTNDENIRELMKVWTIVAVVNFAWVVAEKAWKNRVLQVSYPWRLCEIPVQCKCSFLLIRLSFRYIWLLKKRFHNRNSLKCFTRSPVYHLDIFTLKMKAIVALHKKIVYFTLRGESDTKIWIRCLNFTQRH